MTGEPRGDVPLRDYVDQRINSMLIQIETRFALALEAQNQAVTAIERATEKAENQLNYRLEGMNEFRDTLRDQAAGLATKESVEVMRETLRKEVCEARNESRERADRNAELIAALKEANAQALGRQEALIWGLGVVMTVIGLLLRFL